MFSLMALADLIGLYTMLSVTRTAAQGMVYADLIGRRSGRGSYHCGKV